VSEKAMPFAGLPLAPTGAVRFLALLALIALPLTAAARTSAWDRPTPRIKARAALREVIRDIRQSPGRGRNKKRVVLDWDDTVDNARPRLTAAARRAELPTRGVSSAADLYAGLLEPERAEKRARFGSAYFDDLSLLRLDRAQRGARRFVRDVIRAGGGPLYVSGRWESMREVTEQQGRDLRLPKAHGKNLLLNPGPQYRAREWKRLAQKLVEKRGEVVAAIDNEATAASDYHRAFPNARIFRLNTFRLDEAPARKPKDVIVMRDFKP
jgi:hypothetical protein